MTENPAAPGILRRLASMLYDSLLVLALLVAASFLVIGLVHEARSPIAKLLYQGYLLLVLAGYFLWFWLHGGQTLPMKTWRCRLVSADGTAPTLKQAAVRFVAALLGIGLLGFGIWWALLDRDRQFLHDHLAGTKVITG